MPRNNLLDGWRGIAIMAVLIGHFLPTRFIEFGRLGVELFFVLSGRLMAELLFVRNEGIGRFYWRRITRIFPTLYLYICILLLIYSFYGQYHYPEFFDATSASLFSAATFTYNYLHELGYASAVCDHLWSLCIEEHAYLAIGITAILYRNTGLKAWPICFILALMCMAHGAYMTFYDHLDFYDVYWRTDTHASSILLGSSIFMLIYNNKYIQNNITQNTVTLLIMIGIILNSTKIDDPIKYSAGTIALAVAVCEIDKSPAFIKTILGGKLIGFMGRTSFSIYIFQQLFFLNQGGHNVIALILAVLTGLVISLVVEQPIREKLNKFTNQKHRSIYGHSFNE